MKKSYILNTIVECSGKAGLSAYETMPLNKFIEWFRCDISFNDEESRKQGEHIICVLENASK